MNIEKKVYNVLIFPAGSEIAFEINNALKYSKFVNIYGGSSIVDHSEMIYKNYCSDFPYINDGKFIEFLNNYIKKNKIDYIYPAMDMVQVFLTDNAKKIDATIVTSDEKTVDICRSKKETYKLLKNEKFIPKTYKTINDVLNYPVFIKPAIGQGAQGAKKIESQKELKTELANNKDMVICEYLPGIEYTIDCFTDKNKKLRYANIRSRDRIRTGISVRSTKRTMNDEIKNIAKIINEYFNFNGAWFFQMKQNPIGEFKLMEISPRIPGTMGLSRNIGINFPLLTLYNMWGFNVDIIENDYDIVLDRAFINRFKLNIEYDSVYIDFDDTITNKGKINLNSIRYLYQLVNDNKNIYLLTRHKNNIYKTLDKYKITKELFTEIIEIETSRQKSEYITNKNSIFIDDSFKERKEVKENVGINVFDVDMIESLLDWRE